MVIDGFVHPAYSDVAEQFRKLFASEPDGGGAIAAYQHGRRVLDLWGGYVDGSGERPWRRDTMAMSFSTTKGVVSTVVHVLADRDLIDYDEPVARYWPEFGVNGKEHVTVRHLLSHRAGLHNIRDLITDAADVLDHQRMRELLAEMRPRPRPGRAPGYHAFTYGWLVDGLVRAVTGRSVKELIRTELAEPLKLDGLQIGAAPDERDRVAVLFPEPPGHLRIKSLARFVGRFSPFEGVVEAFGIDGVETLLFEEEQRILDTEMPSANGVFTARSLAKLYGGLANGGMIDDVQILSGPTLLEAGRVQTRQRDYVLGLTPRWRLGYHQAFTLGSTPRMGFGHFGFGGSGGWADPETGLGVGFVTNRMMSITNPLADVRLVRLNRHALAAARETNRADVV